MRGRSGVALSLAALAALAAAPAALAQGGGKPELRRIASFEKPVHVAQAPGQPRLLYVVEQPGRVMIVRRGRKLAQPFLDLRHRVRFGPRETDSVEAGMYSIAFDPRYARTGRFYLFYTANGGDNRVESFRRSAGSRLLADPRTRRSVIKIPHPFDDSHNGGQLQIGPDRKLWISTGDGGCCGDPRDRARNLGSPLGKLLRIKPRRRGGGYRVPPGNPLSSLPGARTEIWAWGLRNPWRFSFDRLTGAIAIADVGDNDTAQEEIDYAESAAAIAGANFGWPEYEGYASFDPSRPGDGEPVWPIHAYEHAPGLCAVTGGPVVRDPALARLWGRYLYADFCAGEIRSLVPATDGARKDRSENLFVPFPSSFGEGLRGQVYVASRLGPVFRLRAKPRRG